MLGNNPYTNPQYAFYKYSYAYSYVSSVTQIGLDDIFNFGTVLNENLLGLSIGYNASTDFQINGLTPAKNYLFHVNLQALSANGYAINLYLNNDSIWEEIDGVNFVHGTYSQENEHANCTGYANTTNYPMLADIVFFNPTGSTVPFTFQDIGATSTHSPDTINFVFTLSIVGLDSGV